MSDNNESGAADAGETNFVDDVAYPIGDGDSEAINNAAEPQQQPPPQQPTIASPATTSSAKNVMPMPMSMPAAGNSSTEQLVKIIVQSLQEIGLEEMDVREIMQLVKVKVKKLRYSILLPGEDPRKPIVQQLVEEERIYVANLEQLVSKYLVPLRNMMAGVESRSVGNRILNDIAGGTPLKKPEFDAIFGNIEEIYGLHGILYDRLKVCLHKWPTVPIGGIFGKLLPKMKIYISYVSNFNHALETLRMARDTSKSFAAFLQKTGSIQELERLLQAPLQHITRHKLVLKLLEEQTPVTDPEHTSLNNAVKDIKNLQNAIHSNRQRSMQLLGIANRILGFKGVLGPGRELITEGPLGILENGVKVDYYIFLFNDMLIYTTPQQSANQYRFKGRFLLSNSVMIKDSSTPGDPILRHSLAIVLPDQKTYTLIAPSFAKKDEWQRHLDSAIYHGDQHRMFGIRLQHLIKKEASGLSVPRIVNSTIKHLEEKALDTEGLFRISGSAFNINSCREALDSGVPVDLNNVDNHVVAGLLKLYFRELPESIVPTSLYKDFLGFAEAPDPVARLQALVDKLSPVSYNVLSFLIEFLIKVADHSATNKMTASNLGVVFGPNIIWDDNDNDINNSLKVNAIIEKMILHYNAIFPTPTKDVNAVQEEETYDDTPAATNVVADSEKDKESNQDPKKRKFTLGNITKSNPLSTLAKKKESPVPEKPKPATSSTTNIFSKLKLGGSGSSHQSSSALPLPSQTAATATTTTAPPSPATSVTIVPAPSSTPTNTTPGTTSTTAPSSASSSSSSTTTTTSIKGDKELLYPNRPRPSIPPPVNPSLLSPRTAAAVTASVTASTASGESKSDSSTDESSPSSSPASNTLAEVADTTSASLTTQDGGSAEQPIEAASPRQHQPSPLSLSQPSSQVASPQPKSMRTLPRPGAPSPTGKGGKAQPTRTMPRNRPESAMPCAACRNIVTGKAIRVLGDLYHAECFVCYHCKQPFANGKFNQKENQFYCDTDFHELFGACKGCNQRDDEEKIEALGGFWHERCFVCTTCRNPFVNGRCLKRSDLPYCKECAAAYDAQLKAASS